MTLTAPAGAPSEASPGPGRLVEGSLPNEVLEGFQFGPVGPRRRRGFGSRRQKVVAVVVILAALGFLLARGLANALNYYLTAKQAVAEKAELGDSTFRIQGTVMPGVHQAGSTLHFSISSANVHVAIVSTGLPPQLFKVGIPVVMAGHWQGSSFVTDQIMVQHGSTYVEAPKAKAKTAAGPR